jgi:hypothetical protein
MSVAARGTPAAYVNYESAYTSTALHLNTAIPAFARKYGLACSACHTVWPELNVFGQAFKDRGYQLGNERDSPINQPPSYWPMAMRITPGFHYESTTKQPVDAVPGDTTSGTVERTLSQSGMDLSGIDFLALGTLYKNITFGLVPTLDPDGTMGIETAFVRFDNLGNSPWANLKVGKFELDNLLSEKRIVTLSNNGSFYQSYHFLPYGDGNDFGIGDNQLGAELMGHSANSYTRYSVAVLSSTDGEPGLGAGSSYDAAFTVSQAYAVPNLGLERLGLYAYVGQRPTVFQTVGGEPVPGIGQTQKAFYRLGFTGNFSLGSLELLPFFLHGSEDKALAGGTQNATWNGALLEGHYFVSHQLALIGRYEMIRMSQQSNPATPKTLGNIDAITLGFRAYPIMFSRDGLAIHGEYSLSKTIGMAPLSGDGTGGDPLTPGTAVMSSSLLLALDFAF